jgi:hypothetical protein
VSSVGFWIRKRSHAPLHLKSYERTEAIVEKPDSVDKFRIAVCFVKVLDIPVEPFHCMNVARPANRAIGLLMD